MASPCYRPVQCTTVDKTIIKARLYEVPGPAPAIVMTHGFNCIKELTLPEVAEAFQSHGYNVLIYDSRSVGESGGEPRNLLDPLQMAEDLSDVYTYVGTLQSVDTEKIFLWGMSFGAVVTACSAAVDRRPKAIMMLCPLFSFVQPDRADKAYALVIKDRVSQLHGNKPCELAPFTSSGDNPIGLGGAGGPGGREAYDIMKAAANLGIPHFRDRIALQTYHKLAMFRPKEYMDMIKCPVLMVIPELDRISSPEEQKEAFARIKSPKREYFAKGKSHLNIVTGDGSKELVARTLRFIEDVLEYSLE